MHAELDTKKPWHYIFIVMSHKKAVTRKGAGSFDSGTGQINYRMKSPELSVAAPTN